MEALPGALTMEGTTVLTTTKSDTRKTKTELSPEKRAKYRLQREKLLRLLTWDKISALPLNGELVEGSHCCLWHDDESASAYCWTGREGYPLWFCHACRRTRTAIDLVGLAYGLDWSAARKKALELVGGINALGSIKLSLDDLRAKEAAARELPRRWPIDDTRHAFSSPLPVSDRPGAIHWLKSRGLDPEIVERSGIAFGTPRMRAPAWMWARSDWDYRGYGIVVPLLSSDGQRVSFLGRQTHSHHQTQERSKAKCLYPPGSTCDGLVMANGAAWRLLPPRLDEAFVRYFFPEAEPAAPLPTTVEVAEGVPDFLRRCESTREDVAVFGIFSGSWSQAIADKIPDGATVKIYTHSDAAGMAYQHEIAESLRGRCTILVRHQRQTIVSRCPAGSCSPKGMKDLDEVELCQERGCVAYGAMDANLLPYLGREQPAAEAQPEPHAYTDLGNAKRLIDRHGQDIRYVPAWSRWIIWDGHRWEPDELGKIDLLVSDTVEQIPFETPHAPDQLPAPSDPAGGTAADMARAKAEVARVAAERAAAARAAVSAAPTPAAKLRAEAAAASAEAKAVAARAAAEKATAKIQPAGGAPEDDEAARAPLLSWARESQSGPRMREAARVAQARVAVSPGQLDTDPWLINTKSGVVDLRTKKLRPNARDLMQTRICPVEYFEGASPRHLAPRWHAFLDEALGGDQATIDFLQRYAGYSLTGIVKEQKLVTLLGPGGSGKGVFVNCCQHVMGSYGRTFPRAIFADRRPDEHTTDLSDLEGCRFAVVSELKRNSHLATDVVKQITSSDLLPARRMGENNRNFPPTHHLWVMSQWMPRTDADDSGIWRRVQVVSFANRPAKVNENLEKELKEEEASGIFAWMLRGCLEWQRIGLCPPESVVAKTAEIRAEDDVIGNFFDETCIQGPGVGDTEKDDLYQAYSLWCDRNRIRGVLPKNKFGSALEVRGIKSRKSGPTRYWCDLKLVRGLELVSTPRGTLSLRDQSELLGALAVPPKAEA